ncbi:MAG: T9SS type A sorting domain-containing protein [Bacteroidetes bacterium]|nr:T9SS type A sorting domain-containing protein [Bacteroidota bacterium]
MSIKKITIICIIIGLAIGFKFMNSAASKNPVKKFHTQSQLDAYNGIATRAPIEPGEYFLPSTSCRGCHGYDSAQVANINEAGEDVNLVDRWESSMMALSSKDPFWKAKVSHEITVNPAHAGPLQNKCLDCHAPMGAFTSKFHGEPFYSLTDLATDSLGMDGVSCMSCHTIKPTVGFTFSGNIPYDTSLSVYGPFVAPFVAPMQLYEGLTPTYSSHMDESRVCSACHTLITESVDLAGAFTGGHFVEQATYHEYVNSDYPSTNVKCQTCHMPPVNEYIIIANGFTGLTPRTPFNQHTFAGANLFMLNLIKNNKTALGITVPFKSFDSTIVATTAMLQEKSLDFDLQLVSTTSDTAYFKVMLKNKAGHKFPSGYPSRRAVLQFVVIDGAGDTIFQTGIFNNQYRVIGENSNFEGHHDVINQSHVPQIYELVPGDVGGNFTSVLERAAILLKDNRIPPLGFTTASAVYDTVKISNDALADADFNKVASVEGSGVDWVHFAVPLAGAVGNIDIKSKVYFQSVPPKWVDHMFTYSTAEINTFETMYNSADQSPILVAQDSINNVLIPTGIETYSSNELVKAWPTISMDGKVYISSEYGTLIKSVEVFNAEGKLQAQHQNLGFQPSMSLYLPQASGIYYLRIATGNKIIFKKVVKS